MTAVTPTSTSQRYTGLSDRFRSLWTFYQFLGGVFKHQGRGPVPIDHDFQDLYRRLQNLVHQIGMDEADDANGELDRIEAELLLIHTKLGRIERDFPPSLLRRFFDHLKRQDEKILYALVKFYLMADRLGEDALDKLDMLITRLAEVPLEDGRVLLRDPNEMKARFERFARFLGLKPLPTEDEQPLIQVIHELRQEIQRHQDFTVFIESGVLDRFRKCKHRLGPALMHPPILVEVISTNIEAKNRFQQLYQDEEVRILEDTNRIFEIERYVERNPGLAHTELAEQLDTFKRFRIQYDSSRRDDNLKREDILELRQAMHRVIESFEHQQSMTGTFRASQTGWQSRPLTEASLTTIEEPASPAPGGQRDALGQAPAASAGSLSGSVVTEPRTERDQPFTDSSGQLGRGETEEQSWARSSSGLDDLFEAEPITPEEMVDAYASAELEEATEPLETDAPTLREALAPDPLLDEFLDKIFFALDLVVWDSPPEQAVEASEIRRLGLEQWEINAYRGLASGEINQGSLEWELEHFLLATAALRLKMDEEYEEIERLNRTENAQRLLEILECSTASLERGRELEDRFRWFTDDMLYRGETHRLDEINRSRFRFLFSFSRLWLRHQADGGVTPL